ncbi:MAG: hypothetical protein M4579_002100 [Chaenotheca gracillima]|nr:MAG: hypothetical protein M4579_002100 [Chaenotheca gracillima]
MSSLNLAVTATNMSPINRDPRPADREVSMQLTHFDTAWVNRVHRTNANAFCPSERPSTHDQSSSSDNVAITYNPTPEEDRAWAEHIGRVLSLPALAALRTPLDSPLAEADPVVGGQQQTELDDESNVVEPVREHAGRRGSGPYAQTIPAGEWVEDSDNTAMSLLPSFLTEPSSSADNNNSTHTNNPSRSYSSPATPQPQNPNSAYSSPNQNSRQIPPNLYQQIMNGNVAPAGAAAAGPSGGPGGAGSNMGGPGVAGGMNAFPTAAGHQMDLNHLWALVQELSAQLKENRDHTQLIVSRVAEIRRRAAAGEGGMTELLRAVNGDEQSRNVAELQARIEDLTSKNGALDHECGELSSLVYNYEAAVGKILEMVRTYTFEHNQTLNGTHRYYMNELARERQEKIDLQNQQFETQAGIRRVCAIMREGIRQSDGELSLIGENAGLRSQNKVLRRLVGWPVEDSDDEQEGPREGEGEN